LANDDMRLNQVRSATKLLTRYNVGPPQFALSHLFLPRRVVEGNRMYVNPTNNLNLFLTGLYEPLETELVKTHVGNGDTVLDVGANIGYYTVLCAKLVGNQGKVYAFEPDTANFSWLERNVKMNRFDNVVLVRKAVSNTTGAARLHLSERNRGANSLQGSMGSRRSIEIEAIRLSEYFDPSETKVDFIKIDVEGSEFAALQGMQTLLRSNANLKIVTEFWPAGLERSGADPEEYLENLLSNGFTIYEINEGRREVSATSTGKLLTDYSTEGGAYTNLLCLREDGGAFKNQNYARYPLEKPRNRQLS